jgi:hypothetical protein
LLIGVRKRMEGDTEDGGGFYGLFQNTWKNRPLWIEIGFDLLQSMKCQFLSISDELSFEKEFDSGETCANFFSQSSMSLQYTHSVKDPRLLLLQWTMVTVIAKATALNRVMPNSTPCLALLTSTRRMREVPFILSSNLPYFPSPATTWSGENMAFPNVRSYNLWCWHFYVVVCVRGYTRLISSMLKI